MMQGGNAPAAAAAASMWLRLHWPTCASVNTRPKVCDCGCSATFTARDVKQQLALERAVFERESVVLAQRMHAACTEDTLENAADALVGQACASWREHLQAARRQRDQEIREDDAAE